RPRRIGVPRVIYRPWRVIRGPSGSPLSKFEPRACSRGRDRLLVNRRSESCQPALLLSTGVIYRLWLLLGVSTGVLSCLASQPVSSIAACQPVTDKPPSIITRSCVGLPVHRRLQRLICVQTWQSPSTGPGAYSLRHPAYQVRSQSCQPVS